MCNRCSQPSGDRLSRSSPKMGEPRAEPVRLTTDEIHLDWTLAASLPPRRTHQEPGSFSRPITLGIPGHRLAPLFGGNCLRLLPPGTPPLGIGRKVPLTGIVHLRVAGCSVITGAIRLNGGTGHTRFTTTFTPLWIPAVRQTHGNSGGLAEISRTFQPCTSKESRAPAASGTMPKFATTSRQA